MIELWKLLLLPRHKYKCSIWCPTSRPLRDWKSCANHSKNHDGVTQQIDDRLQGFETEARKTLNMVQLWQAATGYTL